MSLLDKVSKATSVADGLNILKDALTLRINNVNYSAWESVFISRSLDNVSPVFRITMADKWRLQGQPWPIRPSSPMRMALGKDEIIVGNIERLNLRIDTKTRVMEIVGRGKTGDLIDSSVIGTNEFKNVSLEDLGIKLAKELFSIPVKVEADIGADFKKWTVKQGESVFETLQRAALLRGLLIIENKSGELVFINRAGGTGDGTPSLASPVDSFDFVGPTLDAIAKGAKLSGTALVQGENVISASAIYDDSERFSDYIVKAQAPGTDEFSGKKVAQVSAFSKDLGVRNFRPLIVLAESSADKSAAQKRADWEATVRAARAIDVSIRVQGWRKTEGGELWDINELVQVEVEYLGLNDKLLIRQVDFTKDANGTFTDLRLTRADAYDPQPELKEENDPTKKEKFGWGQRDVDINQLKGILNK